MAKDRALAPMLVIENDLAGPVARLGDWLRTAGAELDVRSGPGWNPLPSDLSGYSALVVMGGAASSTDPNPSPWLTHSRNLLSEALREQIPALGVCLGAQLLAVAAGGRVERVDIPEYGAHLVAKRQAAASDPLFGSLPITPDVMQWHTDAVTQLPPGAVLLATSATCEVQAFRVGGRAWGLQFHIETTPEIVEAWAAQDAELLVDYDIDTMLARAALVHDDIAEVWTPFAAAFAEVARDPDLACPPEQRRSLTMASSAQVTTAQPITDPAEIRAALAAEMRSARGPH
jgi:GMP synthase-like glutamine amidotransferase